MQISSLSLNNIRSYKNAKIDFLKNGSTLLAGDIGSGKSSLLLAMDFALFGLRTDLPANALLRHGETKGSVAMEFEVDGKQVIVERNLERKPSQQKGESGSASQSAGHIIVDGVKEELTSTEIKSQILDILGYPEKLLRKNKSLLYRYTVYTPQEQMKEILFSKGEERLNTLRHIFGIDKYKTISENAKILARDLKASSKEKAGIASDLHSKKEFLLTIENQMTGLKEQKTKLESELDDFQTKKQETENLLKDAESKLNESRDIQKQIELKAVEMETEKKALKSLETELEILGRKVKNLQSALQNDPENTLRMAESEFRKNQLDLQAAERSKIHILKELEEMEPLREKIAEVNALASAKEQQLTELYRDAKKIDGEITELQIKYQFPEQKIAVLQRDIASIPFVNEKKRGNEKKLQELKQEVALLLNEIKRSEEIMAKFTKDSVCPTCFQKITNAYRGNLELKESEKAKQCHSHIKKREYALSETEKEFAELEKREIELREKDKEIIAVKSSFGEIERLKNELKGKREKILSIEVEVQKIDSARKTMHIMAEKISKSEERFMQIDREISSLNVAVRSSGDRVNMLTRDIKDYKTAVADQLEKFKKMEAFHQHLRLLDNEKWQLNKKLEEFADVEKNFGEMKNLLIEIEKNISMAKQNSARNTQKLEDMTKQNAELSKEVELKEKAKAESQKLTELSTWINDHFSPLMSSIEKHLMAKIQQDFNSLFRNWFSMLIDDPILTARIDNSFEPVIEQNGHQTSFEHLSGGEKTSVALAYRLALNKIVNALSDTIRTKDLLILDEPTDGFSTEQLDKVRDVLEDLNLKQILIVSHEEKVESFVDHIVRFKKENGISRVTVAY